MQAFPEEEEILSLWLKTESESFKEMIVIKDTFSSSVAKCNEEYTQKFRGLCQVILVKLHQRTQCEAKVNCESYRLLKNHEKYFVNTYRPCCLSEKLF